MDVTGTCILPEQAEDKIRQHLPGWEPPTVVKMASFSRSVVLNQIQWFILVIFKGHIPKSEVHGLGDSRRTLSMHCGRYIRIIFEDVQVFLNKSEWSDLMELLSSCMDRQILKLFRLHVDMIELCSKCYESRSFCTPPDTNAVDFESLYDELMLHNPH